MAIKKYSITIIFCLLIFACNNQHEYDLQTERNDFKTKLIKEMKAPQSFEEEIAPKGVNVVYYKSGTLKLKGWVSKRNTDIDKSPAVVFLHGGFAFSPLDWKDAEPFVESGFVLFMPMLRGESGNPGNFEMFGSEVDDVISAGEYVRSLSYVDPSKIFVIGHSIGGSLAILASQSNSPYKKAVAMSGYPKLVEFIKSYGDDVPFNINNDKELFIRNPFNFAGNVKIPLYLFCEQDDKYVQIINKEFSQVVNEEKEISNFEVIDGDHMTMVKPSVIEAIRIFSK